ncbi:MAG: family 20 glycosylhydrolase [Bacteroidales bacterium]|nr:family 20 glycosylhydrolase [Bacteroidales bacterium]
MKKGLVLLVLIFGNIISGMAETKLNIVPTPNKIVMGEGTFMVKRGLSISTEDVRDFSALYLQEKLNGALDFPVQITTAKGGKNTIIFITDSTIPAEGYKLTVTPENVTIASSDMGGKYYGVQTLLQLFPAGIYSGASLRLKEYPLETVTIEDAPRFSYRGFMLDVSRTFFDLDYLRSYIDWMSAHKLNRLHLHLTDDNGWRIEIKKYPELTTKGAWRGKDELIPPTYLSGDERYGGYYTQKEMKELIKYAQERNIMIIPEFDLPGHSLSSTKVFGNVTCGTSTDTPSACGEFDNVWCVGKESNYKILENIIKELASVFPCPYVNIGGDEVIFDYWRQCPDCQAVMEREGFKDVEELHGYFVRRMEKIINKYGKVMMGWDDIQDFGGLNPTSTVVAWRSQSKGVESIKKGQPTIMQAAQYLYVDMQYTPAERGHSWAAIIPLDRIYSYDPLQDMELTPEEEKLVLGVQAGLWTELMQFPPRFSEYQVFPRLCAVAETGWSAKEDKNYEDFHSRLVNKHYDRLYSMGIAFRVEPPKVVYEDSELKVTLPYPSAVVRYTTDGTEPTSVSKVYSGKIITNTPEDFRFSTFFSRDLHSIAVAAENVTLHHYITPKVKVETDIPIWEKSKLEDLTTYNFNKRVRSKERLQAGQTLTYIFDEPIECNTIHIPTGYTNIPFYGVSNGYVEYSYDGVNFIKGEEFYRYHAYIRNPEKGVKAVRIVITGPNDGYSCNFQNLKIE